MLKLLLLLLLFANQSAFAKINDKGWMSFMIQPVIKKDDISEVVLVGMIVKEEELKSQKAELSVNERFEAFNRFFVNTRVEL